jgi:hypothetical protein
MQLLQETEAGARDIVIANMEAAYHGEEVDSQTPAVIV